MEHRQKRKWEDAIDYLLLCLSIGMIVYYYVIIPNYNHQMTNEMQNSGEIVSNKQKDSIEPYLYQSDLDDQS